MMNSIKNWEYYFQDAILSVEEYLSKNSITQNTKSKLQIALENNFLTWFEYKEWAKEYYGFPVLRVEDPKAIINLQKNYQKSLNLFIAPDIWSENLIAIDQWDEQLIILGLEPSEKLNKIKNYIFVLCSPEILKLITVQEHKSQQINLEQKKIEESIPTSAASEISDAFQLLDTESEIVENIDHAIEIDHDSQNSLEILSFDPVTAPVQLVKIDVSEPLSKPLEAPVAALPEATIKEENKSIFGVEKDPGVTMNERIWNNLAENHDSYAMRVRKQFDAYLVLRVTPEETTEIYRMDEDLAKEEINFNVFKYNLKQQNPFQNVYKNHFTETFNISQLGLKILDFRYVCVSVIKLGKKVVGFLVGFKTSHLSQEDISTLESISEKVG